MTTATAESIAAALIAGPDMPEYLRDPALLDLVMDWAAAEAEARQLGPELDAALASDDVAAVTQLSDRHFSVAWKASDALHKLGLTPLGRAQGYPRIRA